MTQKDREMYIEVLLALAGFGNLNNENTENESTSYKLVTKEAEKPINTLNE